MRHCSPRRDRIAPCGTTMRRIRRRGRGSKRPDRPAIADRRWRRTAYRLGLAVRSSSFQRMNIDLARLAAPTLGDLATGRDNNLNLLRMVAASSVLFSHAYALSGHMLDEPLVVASGQRTDAATIGVVVFFAISGFLI